jgi:ligand-binding sensor domain-containing protein
LAISYFKIFAQTPHIQPINYPFQLPTKTIYDLITDNFGQIWLGTDKGLFRFNGKKSTLIPFRKASQTEITNLKIDKKGKIWGMNFSKELFFLENDTLQLFELTNKNDLIGPLWNFDISDNLIWLQSNGTILAYHLHNHQKKIHYSDAKTFLFELKIFDNQAFVSAEKGKVLVFDEKGNQKIINNSNPMESRFFIFNQKLYNLHRRTHERKSSVLNGSNFEAFLNPPIPPAIFIYHTRNNANKNLWICTNKGVWLWDIAKNNVKSLLNDKKVTGVVQDFQGNYWFSTLDEGLWFCSSLQTNAFTPPEIFEKNMNISKVYAFKEKLLIGTTAGKIYQIIPSQTDKWAIFSQENQHEIRQFLRDSSQNLWIAGGSIFTESGKKIREITPLKDAAWVYHNNQKALLVASSSSASLACISTPPNPLLKEFLGMKQSIVLFEKNNPYQAFSIRNQRCISVCVDNQNQKYWCAFDDDLYEYDFKGNFKIIKDKKGNAIIARTLLLDKDNNLWAGTFNMGLYIIKNQDVIRNYNQEVLLENNQIKRIYEIDNQIWVGTDNQIGILDYKQNTFIDILGNVGMSANANFYRDFLPVKNGLWVAMSDKILFIPNDEIERENKPFLLPVRFSGENLPKNQQGIFQFTEVPNEIYFDVEALHYKNPLQLKIWYRIKELSEKWQKVNDLNAHIKYNFLMNGTYTFEVYAEDMILGTKTPIQRITFQIPPYFWQTIYFQVGIFLLVALIFYLILRSWLKRLQRKQSLQEQLLHSQLKTLQAQMNPHFLYNVLNSVQALVYANRKLEASALLGDFSYLMREILKSSNVSYITLYEELNNLELYIKLEKARFDDSFSYQIKVNENTEEDLLMYEIPSMLLQPLVENVFRHAFLHKKGEKNLCIEIDKKDKYLMIIVDDNGIGREKAKEIQNRQNIKKSTGFALNATQQRIKILNEIQKDSVKIEFIDKKNIDNQALGTKIILYLKIEK